LAYDIYDTGSRGAKESQENRRMTPQQNALLYGGKTINSFAGYIAKLRAPLFLEDSD
jgi:hypothetical protein